MGFVLILGGLFGVAFGVLSFIYLKSHGQVDFLVQLCYVTLLAFIGGLIFIESLNALLKLGKLAASRNGADTT